MNIRKQPDITLQIYSKYLKRYKTIDVVFPPNYWDNEEEKFPVLYMNDGQDLAALHLIETVDNLVKSKEIEKFITIAIKANNRLFEYGTANIPDYQNRGNEAEKYTQFLLKELMPLMNRSYKIINEKSQTVIMGFSLGGLSAFDIGWNHSEKFSKIGVFSGSFWWRSKAYKEGYEDTDRIMQQVVKNSNYKEGLSFWLQVGSHDETSDRNNSGIIDAIEDTTDLIAELKTKGYTDENISYHLIKRGEHNFRTWAHVFPQFLKWAFSI